MDSTSLRLNTLTTEFKEVKDTAENAYRLVSKVNPLITSQGVRLLDLVNNILHLTLDIDDLKAKASLTTPAELETLVQSAIGPVKASMDKELALTIKTAETAITSSFDTLVHALNDNVAVSIKALRKRSMLCTVVLTAISQKPLSQSLLAGSMC